MKMICYKLNFTIRYGGSIFVKNQKDLVIFSGTVYQEILIWEINYSYSCIEVSPVLHRLHGHNVSIT